jgi:ADP-ribose pyrophosphatase
MNKIVYKNQWFSVLNDENWYYIREEHAHNGAVILILEDNEQFIFVENYRRAIDSIVIEAPRGYGEEGETSKETAIREAYEETGYKIQEKNIQKIGSVYPNSAILDSQIDIYFASVTKNEKIKQPDKEIIKIVKINKDKMLSYINNGQIKDTFSISAITFYMANN